MGGSEDEPNAGFLPLRRLREPMSGRGRLISGLGGVCGSSFGGGTGGSQSAIDGSGVERRKLWMYFVSAISRFSNTSSRSSMRSARWVSVFSFHFLCFSPCFSNTPAFFSHFPIFFVRGTLGGKWHFALCLRGGASRVGPSRGGVSPFGFECADQST